MANVFLCQDSLKALHLTFGLKGDNLAVIHPKVTAASQCVMDGVTISSASPGRCFVWTIKLLCGKFEHSPICGALTL